MKKILTILFICVGMSAFGQELEPITTTNLRVIINRINTLQTLIGSGGGNGVTEQWVRDEISDSISAIFDEGLYIDDYLEGFEPALGDPASNGHILSSTTTGVRSWIAPPAGGTMTWPSAAGIPIYSGSQSWGTSITNNSANWDAAYGWGNHSGAGYYVGTDATIRQLLSTTATGLTYTNTTGVLSLTNGYTIPQTTSTTNWNTAYNWGNHKVLDINTQTSATYTLVLADAHRLVIRNNSSANTVTVPTNTSVAFPVGTQITVVQTGTGTTSIAAAGGVTINSADGALDLRVQYSACSLVKTAINTWLLIGDIE